MEIQRGNSPFPKLKPDDAILLTLIKSDFLYSDVIKEYRWLANIPENGIDYTKTSVFVKEIRHIDSRRLFEATFKALFFYNLPIRWFISFLFILLIDEPSPPSDDLSIKSVDVRYVEPVEKSPYQYGEIIISVRQGISKSKLIDILHKDKTLDEMLSKLPNNPDVSKIETKHALEAIESHKNNMTLSDIATMWNKREGKKYDYKMVNKILTNFKTYIIKHSARNPRARLLFTIEQTMYPKEIA